MWDLDTIIRENNQAAVEVMMHGFKVDGAEVDVPKVWTLDRVAEMLRIGPPLLSDLMNACTDINQIQKFLAIIRAYLPEHEEEILTQARNKRVERFCYLFSKRHFPLPPYASRQGIDQFVGNMPITLMAMNYDAYHDLDMRPGCLLLLSLVVYPYTGSERDAQRIEDIDYELNQMSKKEAAKQKASLLTNVLNGPRVALLDMASKLVGQATATRIPTAGWHPKWLHKITDGTQYDGVGAFADWACSNTGLTVLDCSYSDFGYESGSIEPYFSWSKGNVAQLTDEWPKVKEFRARIDKLVGWVEADLQRNFPELVEFLASKRQPKEKQWSWDDEEHFYRLAQPPTSDDASEEDINEAFYEDVRIGVEV